MAALIVPFTNWRGDYEHGYFSGMPECTQLSSACLFVDWRAPKMRVYRDGMPEATGDWVGSLLQEQQDGSGLLYQRNRYYDPMTGQFTKMDPIGLAGGLNLYGFAAGDPVNFSDPLGLKADTSWIGVRRLEGAAGAVGNHASVMVGNSDGRQLGELLNNNGTKEIDVRKNPDAEDLGRYKWTILSPPAGMSESAFDQAMIGSFNMRAKQEGGTPYHFWGSANSNHFVWSVVTGAGGRMPYHGDRFWGFTPGYCGGSVFNALARGSGCTAP